MIYKRIIVKFHCKSVFCFLILFSFASSSCENQPMLLRSEKKIKQLLEGKWKIIYIPETSGTENWTFTGGKVYRVDNTKPIPDTIDISDYSIKTTLTAVYLDIPDFLSPYDGEWDVVRIDDEVLIMVHQIGGLLQYEFVRQQ